MSADRERAAYFFSKACTMGDDLACKTLKKLQDAVTER